MDTHIERVDVFLEFFAECASDHLDWSVVQLFDDAYCALNEALAPDAHHHFALALLISRFTEALLHALREASAQNDEGVFSWRNQTVGLEYLY